MSEYEIGNWPPAYLNKAARHFVCGDCVLQQWDTKHYELVVTRIHLGDEAHGFIHTFTLVWSGRGPVPREFTAAWWAPEYLPDVPAKFVRHKCWRKARRKVAKKRRGRKLRRGSLLRSARGVAGKRTQGRKPVWTHLS